MLIQKLKRVIGIPIYHEILMKAEDAEKNTKDLSDDAGAVTVELK